MVASPDRALKLVDNFRNRCENKYQKSQLPCYEDDALQGHDKHVST